MAIREDTLREGDLLARRYQLVERIGAGGMAVIWQGYDRILQRDVAIKVRDAPLSATRTERELIRHEAQATAHIDHPDAIEVYDYGEAVTSRGRLAAYVVMQLVDGQTLTERIEEGPLPWRDAVLITIRVADVLATAHRRGIVHRDVTPDNVVLTSTGVKLLDFGIAARIGEPADQNPGTTFGTPPYVAPERLVSGPVVPATDVYSLGVLLFEMLTGRTPYRETTWEQVENARRVGPPPVPSANGLPGRVARLCQRCLTTQPAERPTMDTVVSELRAAMRAERLVAATRRRAVRATAVLVAAAAVSAGTVLIASHFTDPNATNPNAAPSLTVGATTAATPSAGATPSPAVAPSVGKAGSATPSATPSVTASPAPPLSVDEVVDNINTILSASSIRPDVANDLRQIVNNVVRNPLNHPVQIDALRRKTQDRVREGSLTRAIGDQLDAAYRALNDALTRETRTP